MAVDVSNVETTTTLTFSDVEADATIEFNGATGTIVLDNVATGSDLVLDGAALTSATVSGSVDGDVTFDLTADAEAFTTLNLALTSDGVVELNGQALATEAFTTVNASASTGALEFLSLNNGNNFVSNVSLGSGDDTFYYDTDYNNGGDGGAAATLGLGAGNDTITLALYDSGSNTDATTVSLTLGAGSDQVTLAEEFNNIYGATVDDIEAGLVSITDFSVTQDTIDVSAETTARFALTNTQLTDIAGEADLADAINFAAGLNGAAAAGDVYVFNFDGNAYIYADQDGNGALSADDGLIELVGVTVSQLNGTNFVV